MSQKLLCKKYRRVFQRNQLLVTQLNVFTEGLVCFEYNWIALATMNRKRQLLKGGI